MTPPRTLDELLLLLPGLRKRRNLNADWLRLLLDRQRGDCTWCGGSLPKRRRTWCSDACVEAFHLRCSTQHGRDYVLQRDGGVCRVCGRNITDAMAAAKRRRLSQPSYRHPGETKEDFEVRHQQRQAELWQLGFGRGRWYEVDHSVPVSRGGGLCRVEDLRLVCGACHEELTAALKRWTPLTKTPLPLEMDSKM